MKNKNVKRISMILAALMVAGAATGCGAKKDTKVESTNKVATNSTKLDEDAIKDTYTGIDDMYVLEGSKDVDYLDGVLYDSSIVKGIDVDSSKVDTSKTGNYKITFGITADRTAYDAFRDAFIKSETVKDKLSTDKTKTETVKVKKDTVVVNKDEAQKLADQNKLVRTDNGETVKKSDGTEVKTEQKAPASTAVTGGNVVDASAKTEVKPETTATPTMDPKEEAKKEESKKDDKKEETKKPSTSDGKDNSGSTNKPSSGSNSAGNTSKPNSGSNNGGSSNKPSSGSNNSNGGNSSNTEKPAHKHNWVNVTKTVNHPAETHQEDVYEDRQVKVKDAWDEQVRVDAGAECRQCGYRTTNPDDMTMHCLEYGHSSHNISEYKTVHHDAVYETQRVKTGTKTVVDKAAWTETVVTGQKCSFCGETKTN